MSIYIDERRGEKIAARLVRAFYSDGIFGKKDMPEDALPLGVVRGSLEHVFFITLTVSIDYQRDAHELWEASRKTYEDPGTRYLFNPNSVHITAEKNIVNHMQRYKLSKKPRKDAEIWRTIITTFYEKWGGDPRRFLQECNWDAPVILERLERDRHIYNRRSVLDFPYLRGPKIGPLWLRMLRDNVGITDLLNMNRVPIPVDVHVARATLVTGVLRGSFSGNVKELYSLIREGWFKSVEKLLFKNRPMISIDVDEPLWHLSKFGCSNRDPEDGRCMVYQECAVNEFCVKGRIDLKKNLVNLDT